MVEQQKRFLEAVYTVQGETGRAHVLDIAGQLGLDIINNIGDRDLYQETTLGLRDAGYLDCLANNYRVTCGLVKLTPYSFRLLES